MEEQQKTVMVLVESITLDNTDAGKRYADKWLDEKQNDGFRITHKFSMKTNIIHYELTKVEIIEE